MVRYNLEEARSACLEFCSGPPKTISQIALHLQSTVQGFYPTTKPHRVGYRLKEHLLKQLVEQGLLVAYSFSDPNWAEVRAYVKMKKGIKARKLTKAYQTSFLHVKQGMAPPAALLKQVPKKENLELTALLSALPEINTWKLINFLLCAREKNLKQILRIYLYVVKLPEAKAELFERLLDLGEKLIDIELVLKPDVDAAKKLIERMK